MAMDSFRRPWLVASWPGMGAVGQVAGAYLVRKLGATAVGEIDPRRFFDVESIAVRQGLARPAQLPRTVFYGWRDPAGEHDLMMLVGDRQPTTMASRYAEALMDAAVEHGVKRVITFAAMAAPIHPTAVPRVLGVATNGSMLEELQKAGIVPLEEGEISGLNGTFLAAAGARDIPAACLLGEFPFFAAQVPNPKSSAEVVAALARLRGIEVDVSDLKREGEALERDLIRHLEGLQRAAREASEEEENGDDGDAAEAASPPEPEKKEAPVAEREPSRAETARIESLFKQAAEQRSKAFELKSELDRLGLFKRYEDRFLDLFKSAG